MSVAVGALKHYVRIVGGSTPPAYEENWDGDVNWLTPTDVAVHHRSLIGEGARKLTQAGLMRCSAVVAPANSIVMTTRAPIGNMALTELPSSTNQGCRTLSPGRRLDCRFLLYQLQVRVDELQARGAGATFLELSGSSLGAVCVRVPALDRQRQIVEFLDREHQRLISLRGALEQGRRDADELHRGLFDERTGTRPRMRLRFALAGIEQGWSPVCDDREPEGLEWGVLKLGCVNYGRFSEQTKALSEGLASRPALEVRGGDLLMSRANTRELVGSAAVVDAVGPRVMLSDLLYRLRVDEQHWCAQYLATALSAPTARAQIAAVAAGSAGSMPKLNQQHIKSLTVPTLDLAAQHETLRWLECQSRVPQALETEYGQLVTALDEYRDALITEAVTGQLDVTRLSDQQLDESAHAAMEGDRPEVLSG